MFSARIVRGRLGISGPSRESPGTQEMLAALTDWVSDLEFNALNRGFVVVGATGIEPVASAV